MVPTFQKKLLPPFSGRASKCLRYVGTTAWRHIQKSVICIRQIVIVCLGQVMSGELPSSDIVNISGIC
jgi:hypothetical protein